MRDISGVRFGRLVVTGYSHSDGKDSYWTCRCDCGNDKTVRRSKLVSGEVKSCRCLQAELRHNLHLRHGLSGTSIHNRWQSMVRRCHAPGAANYRLYGGRGISVCDRWRQSFEAFYADMGDPPTASHSLERIDTDGNYEPGNVVWATSTEQCNNKRNNRRVEFMGQSRTIAEWARETGLADGVISWRLDKGWELTKVFGSPVGNQGPKGAK